VRDEVCSLGVIGGRPEARFKLIANRSSFFI
jgi:hypothetical protein